LRSGAARLSIGEPMKSVLVVLICILITAIELAVLVAIWDPRLLLRGLRNLVPVPRRRTAPRRVGRAREAH
jgi:hypothetical protein